MFFAVPTCHHDSRNVDGDVHRSSSKIFPPLLGLIIQYIFHAYKYARKVLKIDSELVAHPQKFLSWHPNRETLAVSARNSCCLTLLETATGHQQTLEHDFMRSGTFSFGWCSQDSSSLVLGTHFGMCFWELSHPLECNDGNQFPWMKFLQHPNNRHSHVVCCCPQGRFLLSLSWDETLVRVWDYMLVKSNPLYCLDGNFADNAAWSPSGQHICISSRKGDIMIIETFSWTHTAVRQLPVDQGSEINLCRVMMSWLGKLTCILCTAGTNNLYVCRVADSVSLLDSTTPAATIDPTPLYVDVEYAGRPLVVSRIAVDSTGTLVALSFQFQSLGGAISTAGSGSGGIGAEEPEFAPLVAVYSCQSTPTLSFKLICDFEWPRDSICARELSTARAAAGAGGSGGAAVPKDFEFRPVPEGTRKSPLLAIYWSTGVVSLHGIDA